MEVWKENRRDIRRRIRKSRSVEARDLCCEKKELENSRGWRLC